MKKLILTVLGAMMLAVPAVQAQKMNRAVLMGAIEKSDAEAQDVKKNTKAAVWIKRAQAYFAALEAPTKECFKTMPAEQLKKLLGEPKSVTTVDIAGGPAPGPAECYSYSNIDIYLRNGQVYTWSVTKDLVPDTYAKIMESFDQAYALDPKQAPKIKAELLKLVNYYAGYAETNYEAAKFNEAGEGYSTIYRTQQHPAYGEPAQAEFAYNAGYCYLQAGLQNVPEAYEKGLPCLQASIENGYAADGNAYYYLSCIYQGLAQNAEGDARMDLLQNAKSALEEGISKYPSNDLIVNGFLMLFNVEPSLGDPTELTELIKSAIERDPESLSMWLCLATVNYKMQNFDEAIEASKQAYNLYPDLYDTNYYVGCFYAAKGDACVEQMSQKSYTRQADYDADLEAMNACYRDAVPYLEKAFGLQPSKNMAEMLRSIFFRLRDEDGMMDKFNHYKAVAEEM